MQAALMGVELKEEIKPEVKGEEKISDSDFSKMQELAKKRMQEKGLKKWQK